MIRNIGEKQISCPTIEALVSNTWQLVHGMNNRKYSTDITLINNTLANDLLQRKKQKRFNLLVRKRNQRYEEASDVMTVDKTKQINNPAIRALVSAIPPFVLGIIHLEPINEETNCSTEEKRKCNTDRTDYFNVDVFSQVQRKKSAIEIYNSKVNEKKKLFRSKKKLMIRNRFYKKKNKAFINKNTFSSFWLKREKPLRKVSAVELLISSTTPFVDSFIEPTKIDTAKKIQKDTKTRYQNNEDSNHKSVIQIDKGIFVSLSTKKEGQMKKTAIESLIVNQTHLIHQLLLANTDDKPCSSMNKTRSGRDFDLRHDSKDNEIPENEEQITSQEKTTSYKFPVMTLVQNATEFIYHLFKIDLGTLKKDFKLKYHTYVNDDDVFSGEINLQERRNAFTCMQVNYKYNGSKHDYVRDKALSNERLFKRNSQPISFNSKTLNETHSICNHDEDSKTRNMGHVNEILNQEYFADIDDDNDEGTPYINRNEKNVESLGQNLKTKKLKLHFKGDSTKRSSNVLGTLRNTSELKTDTKKNERKNQDMFGNSFNVSEHGNRLPKRRNALSTSCNEKTKTLKSIDTSDEERSTEQRGLIFTERQRKKIISQQEKPMQNFEASKNKSSQLKLQIPLYQYNKELQIRRNAIPRMGRNNTTKENNTHIIKPKSALPGKVYDESDSWKEKRSYSLPFSMLLMKYHNEKSSQNEKKNRTSETEKQMKAKREGYYYQKKEDSTFRKRRNALKNVHSCGNKSHDFFVYRNSSQTHERKVACNSVETLEQNEHFSTSCDNKGYEQGSTSCRIADECPDGNIF